jgi:hypothetical protein
MAEYPVVMKQDVAVIKPDEAVIKPDAAVNQTA